MATHARIKQAIANYRDLRPFCESPVCPYSIIIIIIDIIFIIIIMTTTITITTIGIIIIISIIIIIIITLPCLEASELVGSASRLRRSGGLRKRRVRDANQVIS